MSPSVFNLSQLTATISNLPQAPPHPSRHPCQMVVSYSQFRGTSQAIRGSSPTLLPQTTRCPPWAHILCVPSPDGQVCVGLLLPPRAIPPTLLGRLPFCLSQDLSHTSFPPLFCVLDSDWSLSIAFKPLPSLSHQDNNTNKSLYSILLHPPAAVSPHTPPRHNAQEGVHMSIFTCS